MAKKLLDREDIAIYEEAFNGDITKAFLLWCRYYFNLEEVSVKQECLAVPGWNPRAINKDGQVDYNKLFLIRFILAIGGIRSGKTLGALLAILFQMWLLPDLACLNAAPSVDQASAMYRLGLGLIASPRFDKFIRRPDGKDGIIKHPYPQFCMWNGSTFEFRSTGYECELLRSREWDRINADEAQLIREAGIRTLQGRALGFDLKTQRQRMGVVSLTGSPLSTATWLRTMCDDADPENPRRNPAHLFLRFSIFDNIKNLGKAAVQELLDLYKNSPQLIEQELYGRFVNALEHPFPNYQAAFLQSYDETKTVMALENQIAIERGNAPFDSELTEYALAPEAGHVYIASWDLGKGMTKRSRGVEDLMGRRGATIGLVLDITNRPWKMVAYKYMIRNYKWGGIIDNIRSWKQKYFDCETVVDGSGLGDPINEWASEQGVDIEFPMTVTGSTSSGTKVALSHLLNGLQLAFGEEWVKMPFLKIPFQQVAHYNPADDNLPQDFVMTLAGAVWHAKQREEIANAWSSGSKNYQISIARHLPQRRNLPRRRRSS